VATTNLPYQQEDACAGKEPESVLDRMTIRRKGVPCDQGFDKMEATPIRRCHMGILL